MSIDDILGEWGGQLTDPLMMRFVERLVKHGVVQNSVDPVDTVVRE
jgi:hypothetical protein